MIQSYWYVYFDENFVPYYVGEGSRRRYLDTHRVTVPPSQRILKVCVSSKQEAQKQEHFLVTRIGRKDLSTGPLLNLTDGGPGCVNPCTTAREAVAKTGRWVGRMHAESGHLASLRTPEHQKTAGLLGGLKNVERMKELGRKNVESGHLARVRPVFTPQHQKIAGRLGARAAMDAGQFAKGNHFRWHVNRAVTKAGCELCEVA